MPDILDAIVARKRLEVAAARDRVPTAALEGRLAVAPPPRDFFGALTGPGPIKLIAEFKRKSPSAGAIRPDATIEEVVRGYADAGASCLSVLTDVEHFGGSVVDLVVAREASGLPVIRKDFTVCAADVCDARLMGADCVLLIAAALSDDELSTFGALALDLGLDVLVEVHDEAELDRALVRVVPAAVVGGPEVLVGVNQRDLETFRVDQERAVRVAAAIPEHLVRVAESGVRGRDDAVALRAAGYDAVLVGEHLVTADDPAAALAALRVGGR